MAETKTKSTTKAKTGPTQAQTKALKEGTASDEKTALALMKGGYVSRFTHNPITDTYTLILTGKGKEQSSK